MTRLVEVIASVCETTRLACEQGEPTGRWANASASVGCETLEVNAELLRG